MLKKIIPIVCLFAATIAIIAGLSVNAMPFGTIIIPMTPTGFGVNLPEFKDANKNLPWITESERQAIADSIYDGWAAVKSGTPTEETEKYFEPEVRELLLDISKMWRTNYNTYNFIIVGIDGITPKKIRTFQKTFPNAQYVAFVDLPHGLGDTGLNY